MTININGYEVEIKAKYTHGGEIQGVKYNKLDTMAILNTISLWAQEASEFNNTMGCHASAKAAKKAGKDIFCVLDSKGYYKGC